jgi:hypothetical protein
VLLAFIVISAALDYLSGWYGLAKDFRATEPVVGESFWFVSGLFGQSALFPTGYRSCLIITVNNAGFKVSVMLPFSILAPTLFIPWDKIESIDEGSVWFRRHVIIHIYGYQTAIMISGGAGRSIAQEYLKYRRMGS